MKKVLISLSMIAFVGVVAAGATGAFFSDTETSTGNTLAAGSIDLGIDNESFYNGGFNEGTSWDLSFDLGDDQNPYLFFNFDDLKPGDYGEDTISVHVTNNESWLCSDVTLTSNADNGCTEPENDPDAEDGDCGDGDADSNGDLAQNINFLWWADDGDNVLEVGEQTLPAGPLGALEVGQTATVALADSNVNIWGEDGGVLTPDPEDIRYIGKAWCFGDISPAPLPQNGDASSWDPSMDNDENETAGTPEDGGYHCDGASVGNAAQTDSATLDISFRAVQSRNNGDYQCKPVI